MKIFANGQGGKHRHGDAEAQTWRNTTTQVARDIRAAHPAMCSVVVQLYAEDETARAFRLVNLRSRTQKGTL